MPQQIIRIGVLGRSHPPVNRWADRVLRPFAVVTDPVAAEPGALLGSVDGVETRWLGEVSLLLHSGETGHYRDNLTAVQPSVWVAMDGDRVALASIDPYEGEGLAGDPGRVVEAVPMPGALLGSVTAFVDAHHVEEVFHKRKRAPADPDALSARAPRILPPEERWENRRGKR